MRIAYTAEVDALSIVFRVATVTTRDLAEGVVGEYDADGRLAGLEILDARRVVAGGSPIDEVTLEGVAVAGAVG